MSKYIIKSNYFPGDAASTVMRTGESNAFIDYGIAFKPKKFILVRKGISKASPLNGR